MLALLASIDFRLEKIVDPNKSSLGRTARLFDDNYTYKTNQNMEYVYSNVKAWIEDLVCMLISAIFLLAY